MRLGVALLRAENTIAATTRLNIWRGAVVNSSHLLTPPPDPSARPLKNADFYQTPPFILAYYDETIKKTDFKGRDIDDILGLTNTQLE